MWNQLIPHLQTTYTCISIDLPAFGDSQDASFESLKDIALSIHRILQHENAEESILFGHSMGGYILAEYLYHFGSKLKGAGFIHSSAAEDLPAKKISRTKTIDFIESHGSADFFKIFVPSLVADINLSRLKPSLKKLVSNTSNDAILKGLAAMRDRLDHTNTIAEFTKPILFLCGAKDNHYPKHNVYNQASNCQLVQVESIQNVGHLSPLEAPEECLISICKFLQFVKNLE